MIEPDQPGPFVALSVTASIGASMAAITVLWLLGSLDGYSFAAMVTVCVGTAVVGSLGIAFILIMRERRRPASR